MERLRARPNEPFSSNRRQSVRFAVAPKVPRAHESIQELLRRGGMRLAPLRDFLCGERPNRERFEDVRMDAQHDVEDDVEVVVGPLGARQLSTNRSQCKAPRTSSRSVWSRARYGRGRRFGLGVTSWRLRYSVQRATPRASQASAVCPIRPASSSAATISRSRRFRVDSGGSPAVRRFFFGSPTSSRPEPGDVGAGRSRARAP